MESAFRNEVLLKSTRSGRVGEARRIAVANPGTAAVLILPRGDSTPIRSLNIAALDRSHQPLQTPAQATLSSGLQRTIDRPRPL